MVYRHHAILGKVLAEDALAEARALDAHFKSTGKIVGPLHGVPLSVKEMVSFKDRITHASYVSWIKNVRPQDALILRTLRKAGAVFHVRTNLPQTCMVSCFGSLSEQYVLYAAQDYVPLSKYLADSSNEMALQMAACALESATQILSMARWS
jgi:Amidase